MIHTLHDIPYHVIYYTTLYTISRYIVYIYIYYISDITTGGKGKVQIKSYLLLLYGNS